MKNAENRCLNCDNQLQEELYCPICGQKATINDLSIKYLFTSFMSFFVDFDKRLLRSLRDVWVPNKISTAFLGGSRSTYVNHLRFFLISLAALFTLIALNFNKLELNNGQLAQESAIYSVYKTFNEYEASHQIQCDSQQIVELKKVLFDEILDKSDTTITTDLGIIDLNINSHNRKVDLTDAYNQPLDSLYTYYKCETPIDKFILRKAVKMVKKGDSLASFIIGNMLWAIIVMTILMALILKILYFRSKSYYAEHLMQMINAHCVLCLLISVLMFLNLFTTVHVLFFILAIAFSVFHFMFSLKLYYQQNWLKTIVKGFVFTTSYVMLFSIVCLLTLAVSLVLF